MQYTDNEAALIGGLISNYFFQPSVDETLRESYRRVLRHLHENTLSASDLSWRTTSATFRKNTDSSGIFMYMQNLVIMRRRLAASISSAVSSAVKMEANWSKVFTLNSSSVSGEMYRTMTQSSAREFVTLSPIKDKVTYLQNQIIFKERKNS